MSNCNENYVREAAYYLWQNAGCPSGQDEKFWSMALEQLGACSQKSSTSKSGCKKSCSSSATKKSTKSSKK